MVFDVDAICDALVAKKMQKDNFLYYIWNDLLSEAIDNLSKMWRTAPSGTSRSVCIIGRGFVSMAKHLALELSVKFILYPQIIKTPIEMEDCIICVLNEASYEELRYVKMMVTTLKCANKKCIVLYHINNYEHTNICGYDYSYKISVPIVDRDDLESILTRLGIALSKVDMDSISFPIVFSDLFKKNYWISNGTLTALASSSTMTPTKEDEAEETSLSSESETADDYEVI